MIWGRMDVGGHFMPAMCLGGDFPHFKAAEGPPSSPTVLVSFLMIGHRMLTATICIPEGGRGREGGGAHGEGADWGGTEAWGPTPLLCNNFLYRLAVGNPHLRPRPRPLPSTSASAGPAPSLEEPASSFGELTSAPAGPDAALLMKGGGQRLGVLPTSSVRIFGTVWQAAILAPALTLTLCLLLHDLPLLLRNLPHLLGN